MKRNSPKSSGDKRKKPRQSITDDGKIPDDMMLSLLRKHPGIPENFKVIATVQSDESTLNAVRQSLELSKRSTAFSIVFFPVALPVARLRREQKTISQRLTDGAENDIYVVGNHGFVTLNNGKVKAFTPARAMILEEEEDLFNKEKSAMWGNRSAQPQSILVVHDDRENFPPQICFVSKKDMRMIFATSRKHGVDKWNSKSVDRSIMEAK